MDKKEFKVQKKAFKKAKRKAYGPWKVLSIISGPLAIIFCIVMVVCNMFDNTISLLVGGTFWELENEDKNYIYYEGDFATEEERTAAGAELVKQVEAEGAALLMNENKALPLVKDGEKVKVSLFSTSSGNVYVSRTCTTVNDINR